MESYTIELTEAAHKHGNIYISSCKPGFFPDDVYGASSKNEGTGKPITLKIEGLSSPVKTDIPRDRKTGKPRTIFRERKWVKDFVRSNSLIPGDSVKLSRLSHRTYQIIPHKRKLRFIDLFAGIGGTRKAFESTGAQCCYSSEWNKYAAQTYFANFGEMPDGDITTKDEKDIPEHDILVAGFPCQPFSIAGVSKKNALGKAHGFACESQGTLFFDILRILKAKQPRAFLLENVRNLRSHDKGRTYEVIISSLKKLGYNIFDKIIDGGNCVPQHRKRIYIVGTKAALNFEFPSEEELQQKYRMASTLGEILDDDVDDKYTLTDHLWKYLKAYKEKHRKAGNGFGYGLVGPNDTTRTISARYYKDGSEILYHPKGTDILKEKPQKSRPRRLTPRECARLMGFDRPMESNFKIEVSDTQAYRQFGNSVVVPVLTAIADNLVSAIVKNDFLNV